MANINEELVAIKRATYIEDVRLAIANALETINDVSEGHADDISSLKRTVKALSDNINELTANSAIDEINELKELISAISAELNLKANTGDLNSLSSSVKKDLSSISYDLSLKANANEVNKLSSEPLTETPLRSFGGGAILRSGDSPATQSDITQLRADMNEALNGKASQHDFDYIVGNGFQGWTLTDYIIRLREDVNTAINAMMTEAEAAEIAQTGVRESANIVTVNTPYKAGTKHMLMTSSDEIELAEMSDIDAALATVEGYFSLDVILKWEVGGLNEHGFNAEDSYKYRNVGYIYSRNLKITLNSAYSLQIVKYDKNKMLKSVGSWIAGSSNAIAYTHDSSTAYYIRILIKRNNGNAVSSNTDVNTLIQILAEGHDAIRQEINSIRDASTNFEYDESTFYGLAKAAGDTTQSQSSNAVGTYTDEAKAAIQNMFGLNDMVDELTDEILYLDGVISSNFRENIQNIDLSNLTTYGTNGYINATTGKFVAHQGYKVHYFIADDSFEIYHVSEDTNFCEIVVYENELFEHFLSIGSSTQSNLPDENHRFIVIKGNIIAVVFANNITSTEYIKIVKKEIEDSRIDTDTFKDIQMLTENISEKEMIVNLSNLTLYGETGYISTYNGFFTANPYYKVYYFKSDKTCKVYYDGVYTGYLTIAVYESILFQNKLYAGTSLNNNLPTKNNAFSVKKGNVIAVCVPVSIASVDAVLVAMPMITAGWMEGVNNPSKFMNIQINKTSDTKVQITVPNAARDSYIRYEYTKCYKKWDSLSYIDGNGQQQIANNIVSTDIWNNYDIYDAHENPIAQGHSNFIAKVTGELYHIGNGHGNEVAKMFQIIADGASIDFNDLIINETIFCNELRLVFLSDVYANGNTTMGENNNYNTNYPKLDTSGIPIVNFEHHMEITYEIGNIVTVENKLIIKRDNISFDQCHGAMLQCKYEDFSYAKINNAEDTVNFVSDLGVASIVTPSTINLSANPIQKCNKAEMYGKNFYISQEMEKEMPTNETEPRVYCFFYDKGLLKFYFSPIITTFAKFSDESNEIFNTGDIIKVKDIRKINAKMI